MYLIKKSIQVLKNEGIQVFFKRAFKFIKNKIGNFKFKIVNIMARINSNRIINKLKIFNSNKINEIFNFSYKFYFGLIRPMQVKEEFVALLKIFKELNPKYILEIGTANGGTLFCFCKLAQDDATIISIDLPGGEFGGGYPEWKVSFYQAFTTENQKLYLLRKDSHQQETLEEVKKILNGNQLDFLFIDGDHSYEGVKKDFEMYSSLVRKGGIIAFHDVVKHPYVNCEVEKFWNEIKNNYKFEELVKDYNQNWAGIGILFQK